MEVKKTSASATFQRLADKIFEGQIGKNIEVYVDDILVKSKVPEEHWHDLKETFQKIRKFGVRLKPEKCTFGVTERNFLEYLISEKGIRAHPEKVEAIKK